jgi:hypothetical protein
MISTVRVIHRNVKNWNSGEMCLRWTAAGMVEAETRFRKVQATDASRTSPSRSRTTSSAAATPPTRSSPRHSLCNYQPGPAVTESSTTIGTTSHDQTDRLHRGE